MIRVNPEPMADKITLKATKREVFGKKLKKLRRDGLVPANVYGSDVKSLAVTMTYQDFKHVYKQAKETHVVELTIEGETKKRPILISQLQLHPVNRELLHVDLRQVNLKEKINANVVLTFTGESQAVATGSTLVTQRDEIEVEALPTDLPDHLEVDLGVLKAEGDSITVADLKVDAAKVTILTPAEEVIAMAQAPAKEEEATPTEEVTAEGEAPATTEEKKEEAEAKAE